MCPCWWCETMWDQERLAGSIHAIQADIMWGKHWLSCTVSILLTFEVCWVMNKVLQIYEMWRRFFKDVSNQTHCSIHREAAFLNSLKLSINESVCTFELISGIPDVFIQLVPTLVQVFYKSLKFVSNLFVNFPLSFQKIKLERKTNRVPTNPLDAVIQLE